MLKNDMNNTSSSSDSGVINDIRRGNTLGGLPTLKGDLGGRDNSLGSDVEVKGLFTRSGSGGGKIKNLP